MSIDPTFRTPGAYRVLFDGRECDAFFLPSKSEWAWAVVTPMGLNMRLGGDVTVLEADHRSAQEKAAQDTAREALIEKAARIQCDGFYGPGAFDDRAPDDEVRKRYIDDCARLADAGLLAEAGDES